MSVRFVVALAALTGFAAAAAAQSATLNAREARQALFGVEMAGVFEGDGSSWRECIEPGGRTAYLMDGAFDEGRLTINAEGEACFSYRSSGYRAQSCFAVLREGSGFRFQSGPDAPDFVTTEVRRGVRGCSGTNAPIS